MEHALGEASVYESRRLEGQDLIRSGAENLRAPGRAPMQVSRLLGSGKPIIDEA